MLCQVYENQLEWIDSHLKSTQANGDQVETGLNRNDLYDELFSPSPLPSQSLQDKLSKCRQGRLQSSGGIGGLGLKHDSYGD